MPTVYPKDALSGFRNVHKGSCFVLMPFHPAFKRIWATIRESLQSPELNLMCRRADDVRAPNILETILKGIAQAEFILADLSGANSNVFYELGIAHCAKDSAKVILLTQDMSFVPFDLRHLRCITYEDTPSGLDKLRGELTATFAGAATLAGARHGKLGMTVGNAVRRFPALKHITPQVMEEVADKRSFRGGFVQNLAVGPGLKMHKHPGIAARAQVILIVRLEPTAQKTDIEK